MNISAARAMILLSMVLLASVPEGAVSVPFQVLPQGIESVNGSSETMGCTSPLVVRDGVMVCDCNSSSFLIDGISPNITTSDSDWASQLVTVRRNEGTADIHFAHVLLTFGFDTAVSPTGIEIDFFQCPDWDIGAHHITMYFNEEYNFTIPTISIGGDAIVLPFKSVTTNGSDCDSLSTVMVSPHPGPYHIFHILVTFDTQPIPIDWVCVGEVRFLGLNDEDTTCVVDMTSSVPTPTDSATRSSTNTPSTDPTSPSSSIASSDGPGTTILIAIAIVIVVIVLVLLAILIIIIAVVKKRQKAQAKLEQVHTVTLEGEGEGNVELKNVDHKQDEYTADNPLYSESTPANGHHQADPASYQNTSKNGGLVDNPHYYTTPVDPDSAADFDNGLYSVVSEEKKSTLKPTPPPTDNAMYASVSKGKDKSPSPAAGTDSMPVYAMVDKARSKKKTVGTSNGVSTELVSLDLPAVPPKSPELQQDLFAQEAISHPPPIPPSKVSTLPETLAVGMSSNPNYESADALSNCSHNSHETDSALYAQPYLHTAPSATSTDDGDIYSEPIQPSDFTSGGAAKHHVERAGDEEDDGPRIYSSIYTVAAVKESAEKPLEITHENIKELKDLGMGQFGKVVLAQTVNLSLKDMRMSNDSRIISILVAVKKLRSKASSAEREAFDKEIKFMSRLNHPNVVRFLGVCYRSPAFIIMEYMERGDLSLFLQQYSNIVDIPTDYTQIVTSSVVNMALQIASGMKYLASMNFVHRDLASRNCLVDENFTVKLADFGMSRNLYESHYYKIKGNAILPIRWMATECFYGMFSEKTDVWAFGITMWELFTLAKNKPYPHLTDNEVVDDAVNKATNRYIHPRPPACPQAAYEVMLRCWVADRKQRATFEVIHDMLQTLVHT